jgi:hypothetical protein
VKVIAARLGAVPIEDHHRRGSAPALPTGLAECVWREGLVALTGALVMTAPLKA